MIAAEATRATTPAIQPASSAAPPRPGQSVEAIGAEVATLARTDPAAAQARYAAADATLSPVDRGTLARIVSADFDFPGIPGLPDLPSLPSLPSIPGLPDLPKLPHLPNPIDVIKETIKKIGDGLETLERGAEAIKEKLESLPHEIADKVADSMRGDKSRPLTDAERKAVEQAYGGRVDLSKVRFVDGPGNSPIARAAFAKGNPAITIGNTVYFKPGHYSTNFAATPEGRNTLVHELSHVVQYKEMGYGSFGAKYAADLVRVGGDPDKLYDYQSRDTTFATETLEGQAQMVGDYAQLRGSKDPALQGRIADLERRLAGTGIYGL